SRRDRRRRGGIEEVLLEDDDARDRLDRQDIERDDLAVARRGADAFGRDLAPAARRRAEIDDSRSPLQEMKPVVELDQLEGGARAIALALGLGNIGIVELALEPGG